MHHPERNDELVPFAAALVLLGTKEEELRRMVSDGEIIGVRKDPDQAMYLRRSDVEVLQRQLQLKDVEFTPPTSLAAKMPLTKLSGEILRDVVSIYDQIFGGGALRNFDSRGPGNAGRAIMSALQNTNCAEFQFGSELSIHHKLLFWREYSRAESSLPTEPTVRIEFFANGIKEQECKPKIERFNAAVGQLLKDRGFCG